jgi:hypothetical protein
VTKADRKLAFIELRLNCIDTMMPRYHIKSYNINLRLIQYTATYLIRKVRADAFIQKVIYVVFIYTSQFMRIFLMENNYFKWKNENPFDPTSYLSSVVFLDLSISQMAL